MTMREAGDGKKEKGSLRWKNATARTRLLSQAEDFRFSRLRRVSGLESYSRTPAASPAAAMSANFVPDSNCDLRKSTSSNPFCDLRGCGADETVVFSPVPILTASLSVPTLNTCNSQNARKISYDPRRGTTVAIPAIDPDRETWRTSTDFLLSVIGFAVDLANVSTLSSVIRELRQTLRLFRNPTRWLPIFK